jgi:hypothetical protein
MTLLGSKPNVGSGREHRTFLAGSKFRDLTLAV